MCIKSRLSGRANLCKGAPRNVENVENTLAEHNFSRGNKKLIGRAIAIVARDLEMAAPDVQDTQDQALEKTELDQVNVVHRPRLLQDDSPCYTFKDLAQYLGDKEMTYTRGAPYDLLPDRRCWHRRVGVNTGQDRAMASGVENCIVLESYFLPSDLEAHIASFVGHYNHQRYHESLNSITPDDVYTGRGHTILLERETVKGRQ